MNTKDKLSYFNREFSYIEDQDIRKFAELVVENAEDYFFDVPASSSGKYHPSFAKGAGGLVRHTRAVAYFANEFARAELKFGSITQHDSDLLIVAAIAHDIKKQGNGGAAGHTVSEHPFYAAEYVKELNEEHEILTNKDIETLYGVIHSHMGPWGEPKPKTLMQRILFYADYSASRSEIDIPFISEGNNAEVERETEPIMNVDTYVFSFGKTKGMTIKESIDTNRGYMDWMARNEGFNMKDVQNLVREYYKKNNLKYD